MTSLPPKPGVTSLPPLAPGWTEHKAPSGHTYYFHKETKKSTYVRPAAQPPQTKHNPFSLPAPGTAQNGFQAGNYNYSAQQQNPFANNPFAPPQQQQNPFSNNPFAPPQQNPFATNTFAPPQQGLHHGNAQQHPRGGSRGDHHNFPERRKQPEDRPKHRHDIPNCAPWVLVKTKLGRRFVWNKETNESFWKFPQDVMIAVVEFDRLEREKKEWKKRGELEEKEEDAPVAALVEAVTPNSHPKEPETEPVAEGDEVGGDSEYEEVEVTDDEEEEVENASKKLRTADPSEDQPLEMGEDDIAWQLAAMEEEGYAEEEEEEGLPLTEEDCKALFRDLLEDARVNPYHTWEKILEDGILFEDDRYKALPTMKARKECWDEWARDKIHILKEMKAKQEKKDPRVPYMAFLHKYATPKLYWPEFRRKYKKEPEMKDTKLSDKDREKWYREHINRLKLPQLTLKSDLSALLKAQHISALNRSTTLDTLPSSVLSDIRFISLPSSVRDPLVQTYISTLPAAPENAAQSAEEEAEAAKKRVERGRRERALAERERRVKEDQRKQRRDLEYGKSRLREGEEELQRAMNVGKGGLRAQLSAAQDE
ncbi:hypothetical protein GQ43DRAFT_412720 [Delitschia confertaspora ATCC 74209]|uniref:WW domain-containing protein n=1 Tax=Delitschia confertaspora ATCC 74209 TaxID=1513339 RepID=A0A9P4JPC3_9PLEO|nr:hypothetical protein GQ43DRAFT_412720 [Delitschia confertaspora ATCC 74209]